MKHAASVTSSPDISRGARNVAPTEGVFLTDLAVIVAFWCVGSVIFNPVGDFPLSDDWSYARTVRHLLQTGEFRPLGWASMSLITNMYWGALFCLPFGFSFTALHASTHCAELASVVGAYVLVRELGQPRWAALLSSAVLGLNPVYYLLSHTFLTDVLFTALMVWSAVFFARYLRTGVDSQWIVGTALALLGTLSRQVALCIPLAFGVSVLLKSGSSLRALLKAGTPLAICTGGLLAFNHWLAVTGRIPEIYYWSSNELMHTLTDFHDFVAIFFGDIFATFLYLGLFLSPILVLRNQQWSTLPTRRAIFALICFGLVVTALSASVRIHYGESLTMPVQTWDLVVKSGIGPLLLIVPDSMKINELPTLPETFWILVTVISLVGALELIVRLSAWAVECAPILTRARPIDSGEIVRAFFLCCGIVYLLPLSAVSEFNDRYVVPAIPLFAAGLLDARKNSIKERWRRMDIKKFTCWALCACFAIFAAVCTRDFLALNRLRWQATNELIRNDRIDPATIDGGFEFNGWYRYDVAGSGWSKESAPADYLVAVGPVPGYRIVREYSFHNWLPSHVQKLLILQRQ